jgi:hypothetical protein
MRRALAWTVAMPLMAAAPVAAHTLDYRLVEPNAGARAMLLAATGHAYEAWVPLALGALAAAALVGLVSSAAELRARAPRHALWPFLVLPSFAFVLQEHLERLIHDGVFPWHAIADPTFAPGFALTMPFGFAAYFAARVILRVARAVALAFEPSSFPPLPALVLERPGSVALVRARLGTTGRATRGPPA